MKIIYKDPKGREIKLRMDNMDDLWHLRNVMEKGDMVYAWTYRTVEVPSDKLRPEKAEKKRMYLGIEVQDVEFHEFSDRLRIKGIIREGEGIGNFHTLNVEAGDEIKILKNEWRDAQIRIVQDAVKATHTPIVTFLAIEDDEALIAVMRQSGVQQVATILGCRSGKNYEDKDRSGEYFGEVLSAISRIKQGPLIILGPGFTKESFWKFAKEKNPDLLQYAFIEHTGHAGITGILEAIKRGAVERIVKEHRISYETMMVERLLEEMAKDGLAVYGMSETEQALGAGAVEVLLITDNFSRQKKADPLIRLARQTNAKYHIIGTLHEAGKKLESLGGIAGMLRYKMTG